MRYGILEPFSFFIALLGICIVLDFIRRYALFFKNKDTKFRYLPCIFRFKDYYYWIVISLFYIVMVVFFQIDEIRHGDIRILYIYILDILISIICLLIMRIIWQVICGNVILVNDKFIVSYNGRINFGEVNYVEISAVKGIFKMRKVQICAKGCIHTCFFIRNKYTSNVLGLFKDKDISIKKND